MHAQRDEPDVGGGSRHWRAQVRGSASHGSRERACSVRELRRDAVVLDEVCAEELGRYVWLDLRPPTGPGLRALGEVLPPFDPHTAALEIKFKHLFPDDRRRLERAMAIDAGGDLGQGIVSETPASAPCADTDQAGATTTC